MSETNGETPKNIESFIKSIFNKPSVPVQPISDEGEERQVGAAYTTVDKFGDDFIEEIKKSIPKVLKGDHLEDYIHLISACALLVGAFTALDNVFDPRKRTTEQRKEGCLKTAEELSAAAMKTIETRLKTIRIKTSSPDEHGQLHVSIDHITKEDNPA